MKKNILLLFLFFFSNILSMDIQSNNKKNNKLLIKEFKIALEENDIKKIILLVKYIDLDFYYDFTGGNLLHIFCDYNSSKYNEKIKTIIKDLIKNGIDIDQGDYFFRTPLHSAVMERNIDIIKVLVKSNSCINALDMFDATPLHYAALNGNNEIVRYLVKNGAKLDINSSQYGTPIQLAAKEERFSTVETLAMLGANREKIKKSFPGLYKFGNNLHKLFELIKENSNNNFNQIKHLLALGLPIEVQDKFGRTILHYTALYSKNNDLFFEILVANPQLIAIEDDHNNTPLNIVIGKGLYSLFKKLINIAYL